MKQLNEDKENTLQVSSSLEWCGEEGSCWIHCSQCMLASGR